MKHKRKRVRSQAGKRKPTRSPQRRDRFGHFNARGSYVIKRGKLTKAARAKAKKPQRKPTKKRLTLSGVVRKRFSGKRKFEFVSADQYPVSGTLHAKYTANLDPRKLGDFLDKHKTKSAAIILKFKDKEGNDVYRTASSPLHTYFESDSENADTMLDSFYSMLNRYETNKEIGAVDDVQINLFASPKKFTASVKAKATKHKRKRKRK